MIDYEKELGVLRRRLALAHDMLNIIAYYPDDNNSDALTWLKSKAKEALEKDDDAARGIILGHIK